MASMRMVIECEVRDEETSDDVYNVLSSILGYMADNVVVFCHVGE